MNEQIKKLLKQARDIAAKAESEGRDFSQDERTQVSNLLEKAKEIKAALEAKKQNAGMIQEIENISKAFEDENQESKFDSGERGTLGQRFIANPEFQAWFKRIAPNGRVADSLKGLSSPPVYFKSLIGKKELITGASDTSAGAFVPADYTGIYEPIGRFPTSVLDLISRRETVSDVVEFVRQTQQVTQATPVQESNVTEYAGSTGEISGIKPEGTSKWVKVQENVKTVAVWIPATKRALSDASQLRGLIDQELQDDLLEELENQILNGDGVGENFTGIFETAGILVQAWDTDLPTTTRKAITNLEVNGRQVATAWVLNPVDWETTELLKDSNNRYYWGGPTVAGRKQLWGVPVVTSPNVTQGAGLLGNFRKAVMWDRESSSIQVSDSHEDFFIRNMVAILAELRAAFGVIRPSAFVEVPFESGS